MPPRRRRWRQALVVALALGLAVLAGLAPWRAAAPVRRHAVHAEPPLAGPPASAVTQAVAAPPVPAAARSAPHPDADLMRRMKADWCGFGAAEHQRQTQAIHDQASADGGVIGTEAIAQAQLTPGTQVLEQAMAEATQRWVRALARRGDVRSQAVADFLQGQGQGQGDDAAPARARLQASARTSSDPMVTALALLRPCPAGTCQNVEASQWSRLEPANLQAWLTLLRDPGRGGPHTQAGYALDRIASEARHARTYEREVREMLLSLPQTDAPGLQNDAETQLIFGIAAGWHLIPLQPVMQACRSGLADAGTVHRCQAVADLLWQQGDFFQRAMALGLARSLATVRPALRAQWEPRARGYEAAREWAAGESERLVARLSPDAEAPCAGQAATRQLLRDSVARSDWETAREGMREAGADEAALAAGWRLRQGRGELDPPVPAGLAPMPATGR